MPTYFSRFQGSWKLVCICLWHIVYLTSHTLFMYAYAEWCLTFHNGIKSKEKQFWDPLYGVNILFQKYWIFMVILAFLNLKFLNCTSYFSGLLPVVYLCSLILRLCILGQIMWPVQLFQRIHMDQCGTYKENTYI